ncbi:hypothetical protein FACS189429_0580 [Bacteroidia bacterium]|nr:hypothetical protein FACS189429_0580 [Bacteroidia bacterium]
MSIPQKSLEDYARSADAANKGRNLVHTGRLANLKIAADKSLIWGECAGSGKSPYACSADFADPLTPIFRCNCPSRQIPCKHTLGLLYAFYRGIEFQINDIPDEIISKREKLEKRAEKKLQETPERNQEIILHEPKKNIASYVKKIDTQLAGINIAKKIINYLINNGIAATDAKVRTTLQTQIKELGNYYINGIQTAFNHLLLEIAEVKNEEYTAVIDRLNYISALLNKATDYLNLRRENPDSPPELNSAIEEQIGTVWKLTELMYNGLWEENAILVQLSFNIYDNTARREWVDEGIWLNLKNGNIYKSQNFRPYRAAKHIQEDNSSFGTRQLRAIFIYPGDINPRVRWETDALIAQRDSTTDIPRIIELASENYADTVKLIKNSIKNPLADKHPVVLLRLHKAALRGDHLVIEDKYGNSLTIKDLENEMQSPSVTLKSILPAAADGFALAAEFNNDIATGLLSAQPLALIAPQKIIRLLY